MKETAFDLNALTQGIIRDINCKIHSEIKGITFIRDQPVKSIKSGAHYVFVFIILAPKIVQSSVVIKRTNSSYLEQNGRHFAADIFIRIFLNETFCISIQISMEFVPKGPLDNKCARFQVMAWLRTGGKPLPDPMLTHFTHCEGEMRDILYHLCAVYPCISYRVILGHLMTRNTLEFGVEVGVHNNLITRE